MLSKEKTLIDTRDISGPQQGIFLSNPFFKCYSSLMQKIDPRPFLPAGIFTPLQRAGDAPTAMRTMTCCI
jgi:hypothetical protein